MSPENGKRTVEIAARSAVERDEEHGLGEPVARLELIEHHLPDQEAVLALLGGWKTATEVALAPAARSCSTRVGAPSVHAAASAAPSSFE